MKISYQQLLIIMLTISQSLDAVMLYNKSNNSIKYNIFNKKWSAISQLFPKHTGTIPANSSYKINDLDPSIQYVVTFYNVHDAQYNQRFVIKGSDKKLEFNQKSKTQLELPAF